MPAIIRVVDGRPRIIIGGGAIEAAFLAQQAAMAFAEAVGESADAAAGSAFDAATSASNASGSASAAAGSAGTASGAADAAATKASEASDSAAAASGSATTATTQAGIATEAADTAATKASEAADSAAAAVAATANKSQAAAIGITGTAENMGGFESPSLPNNATAKEVLEAAGAGLDARPTSSALAASGGAGMVGAAGGDTVQEVLDAKANLTLANSPNVNAVLSADVETYPVGNELETYSQFNIFAADLHTNEREFTFNWGATYNKGDHTVPYDEKAAKVLWYGGVNAHLKVRSVWVMNPLLTLKEDLEDLEYANVCEFDINNFNKDYGVADGIAGLVSPAVWGVTINGSNATGHTVTGAMAILNTPGAPIYQRGYVVAPECVVQAAFDDYSSATSSYRDSGSHAIGINLGGTYSSAGVNVPGAAPVAYNSGGVKSIASFFDTATTPYGLNLSGTYSKSPIHTSVLPGFANDAAAAAGGLAIGDFYQNSGAVRQRIA